MTREQERVAEALTVRYGRVAIRSEQDTVRVIAPTGRHWLVDPAGSPRRDFGNLQVDWSYA